MRRFLLALLLIAAPLMAADSKGRGYTSRACGFDLDHDGIVGEVGDCNKICNATSGTGPITSDLDSDGDNEEEYYVDCDAGSNGDTGGPEDPFLTITYAMTQLDGPADFAEDIICFTGTCTDEESLISPSGDASKGYWTKTASGNEVRDFRYAQDPGGIFGWDTDGDGDYPPHDTNDTSILDGSGLIKNFHNFEVDESYTQMGHFSIDNYAYHNAESGTDTNLFHGNGAHPEYFRFHDIEIDSWNEGGCGDGDTRIIDRGIGINWGEWENIDFNDIQGKFMRGSGGSSTVHGPMRIQNIQVTFKAMADAAADAACQIDGDDNIQLGRSWGSMTGMEFLDSRYDGNLDNWYSQDISANNGHGISQCIWDVDIINNYYEDIGRILVIDAGDYFSCNEEQGGRITTDVNVERNEWTYSSGDLYGYIFPVYVQLPASHCYDWNGFDGDLRIVNNMFTTINGGVMKGGIRLEYSSTTDISTTTGETLIANNTFNVDVKDYANGPLIHIVNNRCPTSFTNDIRIYNNIVNGLESGERAFESNAAWPGTIEMDYNVWENVNEWRYDGNNYTTLVALRAATTFADNSDTCAPTFVSSSDFHLSDTDTCAQDNAISLAGDFTDDMDGDTRSGWDIGADEEGFGYTPPSGACCTGASCGLTTEVNCAGGNWQGADTVCSPNPCSVEDPPAAGFAEGVTLEGVNKQ